MKPDSPESRRPATYEDVLAAPPNLVAELVSGELFLSPRPATPHAMTGSAIGFTLMGPFQFGGRGGGAGPGGWWIVDEPELRLGDDTLVPDVAGWRRERLPRWPAVPFMTLAPDWVCEVVSPSTAALDRVRKMPIYARDGVRHVWLAHPIDRTLEVYRLEEGRWVLAASFGGKAKVRAEPFDAVEIDLALWWPEEDEAPPAR